MSEVKTPYGSEPLLDVSNAPEAFPGLVFGPAPAEALGIAFCTLYEVKTLENGNRKVVTINVTARSMTSASDALDKLIEAIGHAKEKYNLLQYQP